MQVTRKMSARIHQRRLDMARRGCGEVRWPEELALDCAASARLFQCEATWASSPKKTVRRDCCNVYGMCYCRRVITITYRNVVKQITFVRWRTIAGAAGGVRSVAALICFAGLLGGQVAAQDANESL